MIFMEGEHLLSHKLLLEYKNNVSFIGKGQWVAGPHWSIKQSTVVIRCIKNNEIFFNSSKHVYIEKLTITDCNAGLYLGKVNLFFMRQVSIQNSKQFGLVFIVPNDKTNKNNVGGRKMKIASSNIKCTIIESSFYKNCIDSKNYGCAHAFFMSYSVSVVYFIDATSFTSGNDLFTGVLISEDNKSTTSDHIELSINNCLFYNNSGIASGGLHIHITSILLHIENSSFINNSLIAIDINYNPNNPIDALTYYLAGALSLQVKNTTTALNISNSLFEGNKGKGAGALYMMLGCTMHNYCLYIHQTVFKNNVGERGSALSIASDSANIVFSDVTIASNTYNSELPDNQYSATFLNCAVYHNNFVIMINVTVANNDMTGIVSIGCILVFENKHSAITSNRSPANGGGIWIDRKSAIRTWIDIFFAKQLCKCTIIQPKGTVEQYTLKQILFSFQSTRRKCSPCFQDPVNLRNCLPNLKTTQQALLEMTYTVESFMTV